MRLAKAESGAISFAESRSEASEESEAHALKNGYRIERGVQFSSLVVWFPSASLRRAQCGLPPGFEAALEISKSIGRIVVAAEVRKAGCGRGDCLRGSIP